jgi:hypothetical protein
MKVYAKTRPNENFTVFHSPNISHAVNGFRELGVEIVTYNTIDEIYDIVTRDDIVLDYIDQCKSIFSKFGVAPDLPDYPDCLKEYLGRKIWKDTINSINTHPEKWGVFVKPVKEKVFTGKVINNTHDLIGCGSCYENYEVLCSEPLDIKREWRGFIYYDELIDLRPYSGNYHFNYNPEVIDNALASFKTWKDRPVACSLDFAVILRDHTIGQYRHDKSGKLCRIGSYKEPCEETIFLEANDCYALGNYGLHHLDYAKMISARWSQLLNRSDEFHFT